MRENGPQWKESCRSQESENTRDWWVIVRSDEQGGREVGRVAGRSTIGRSERWR